MAQVRKVKAEIRDMDNGHPNTVAQLAIYEQVAGQLEWVASLPEITKKPGDPGWTKTFKLATDRAYAVVAGYPATAPTVSEAQVLTAGNGAARLHFSHLQKERPGAEQTNRAAVGIDILDPHTPPNCTLAEVEIVKRSGAYVMTLMPGPKPAGEPYWHDAAALPTIAYFFTAIDTSVSPNKSERQAVTVTVGMPPVVFKSLA